MSLGGFVIPPLATSSPTKVAVVLENGSPSFKGKENDANGPNNNRSSALPRIQSMNEVQKAQPLSPNLIHNLARNMPTLCIASRLCVGDQNLSLEDGDEESESGEREVTLQMAAFDPLFLATEDGSTEACGPLLDWISAMKEHIEEQG